MLGAAFAALGPTRRSRSAGAIFCAIVTRPIPTGLSSSSTCVSFRATGLRFGITAPGCCLDCCIADVADSALRSNIAGPRKPFRATAAAASGTTVARPASRCRRAGRTSSFRKLCCRPGWSAAARCWTPGGLGTSGPLPPASTTTRGGGTRTKRWRPPRDCWPNRRTTTSTSRARRATVSDPRSRRRARRCARTTGTWRRPWCPSARATTRAGGRSA